MILKLDRVKHGLLYLIGPIFFLEFRTGGQKIEFACPLVSGIVDRFVDFFVDSNVDFFNFCRFFCII